MTKFPLKVSALRVDQPIGVFYVAILPAEVLLQVAFSDVLSATLKEDSDGYELDGTQRLLQPKRLQLIADYINRSDSAFPNSIILAANYRREDGLIEDEDPDEDASEDASENGLKSKPIDRRWTIEERPNCCPILRIPTPEKLAAIIDGQHRLFAFADARRARLDMNLICSVFLDLPKPYQAQLFATINSTQKPVDKSLTYELFGYNVEEEEEIFWSPDKLAVFLSRKLGTDGKSPLKGRIVIAPKKDAALTSLSVSSWKVSTAVVVEGIMRLFTTNPKKDAAILLEGERKKREVLGSERKDKSPLRDAYTQCQDSVIYAMTSNYLIACRQIFWDKATPESFITKTVGIQALFDILRKVAAKAYSDKDITVKRFAQILTPAATLDFASDRFRNASGSGRSTIRRAIEEKIHLAVAP